MTLWNVVCLSPIFYMFIYLYLVLKSYWCCTSPFCQIINNPHSRKHFAYYKHMSHGILTHVTKMLFYVIGLFANLTIIDLHISSSDTWRLPKTHMMIVSLVWEPIFKLGSKFEFESKVHVRGFFSPYVCWTQLTLM